MVMGTHLFVSFCLFVCNCIITEATANGLPRYDGGTPFLVSDRPRGGGFRSPWKAERVRSNSTRSYADGFVPPNFHKTRAEETFLRETLRMTFIFQDLSEECFDAIVAAFEKIEYDQDCTILKQGDTNAQHMYVLAEGECSVEINGEVLPDPYGTMTPGTIIGELALLYDSERAATITTKNKVKMYRLDKDFFQFIFMSLVSAEQEDIKNELTRIDEAIDKIAGVHTRYGGSIVRQFLPNRRWLWFQWQGTIMKHAWKIVLGNMMNSLITVSAINWATVNKLHLDVIGAAPDASHLIVHRIAMFGKAWRELIGITTFILTFFLSEAYNFWKDMYNRARQIQGYMNDIGFMLATSAKRNPNGAYTPEAEAFLNDIAGYLRLFHALLWARFAKDFRVLLSGRGLSRMLSRGLVTPEECTVLQNLDENIDAHNACLQWITVRGLQGLSNPNVMDQTFKDNLSDCLFSQVSNLRGTSAGMGDALDQRIPLAYVHFVQILVDTFLITAPLGLYAEMGVWLILSVGILTLFYTGLLDLAKGFLDPLDNDDFFYKDSVNMDIGVLIRESNAASESWQQSAGTLPFNSKK